MRVPQETMDGVLLLLIYEGFCSAEEHHSLFTTHHLRSHMPEVGSVHLLSCQTLHFLHLETSFEGTKSLQSATEEPEHKLTSPGRSSQEQFSDC
ncbi:hypothetical protein NDU88_007852 [Pleurodeles waltl]|uniref:Uncharacterized protein n=1 Tax=Pleurodeles waltl TaxID=8319 RepID=A0AAV7STP5_PLEWA|nr:hypothetical protein NDU88_007852 [Pleurodeles waltl]